MIRAIADRESRPRPIELLQITHRTCRREPLCLQSMLCARFPRTRSFTLRSSADRPLPVLTPVAATVSETTKSHHASSTERTDQVTYSGDQARVGVCDYGKRSHNVSPCCGGSSPPNAQNLKRGRRSPWEAFGPHTTPE